jgi:hypothetical protein
MKTLSQEDWDKIENSFSLQSEFFSTVAAFKIFRYTSIDGVKEQIEETPVGENVFFMDYSYNERKISKCKVIETMK